MQGHMVSAGTVSNGDHHNHHQHSPIIPAITNGNGDRHHSQQHHQLNGSGRGSLSSAPSSGGRGDHHMRPVIERGASWSYEETRILLSLWGQDMVQRQLTNSKRTRHVWIKIADRIREHGYERTPDQVRTRVFNMIAEYRRIQKNPKNLERKKKCVFYDSLHNIFQAKDTNGVKAALNNYEEEYRLDSDDAPGDGGEGEGDGPPSGGEEVSELFSYNMSPDDLMTAQDDVEDTSNDEGSNHGFNESDRPQQQPQQILQQPHHHHHHHNRNSSASSSGSLGASAVHHHSYAMSPTQPKRMRILDESSSSTPNVSPNKPYHQHDVQHLTLKQVPPPPASTAALNGLSALLTSNGSSSSGSSTTTRSNVERETHRVLEAIMSSSTSSEGTGKKGDRSHLNGSGLSPQMIVDQLFKYLHSQADVMNTWMSVQKEQIEKEYLKFQEERVAEQKRNELLFGTMDKLHNQMFSFLQMTSCNTTASSSSTPTKSPSSSSTEERVLPTATMSNQVSTIVIDGGDRTSKPNLN